MVISRWERGSEKAEVVDNTSYFVAWSVTRGTFAATPPGGVEFLSAQDAEAALRADGWRLVETQDL